MAFQKLLAKKIAGENQYLKKAADLVIENGKNKNVMALEYL